MKFETWIDGYARRLHFGLYLQRLAQSLAVFLFVFGSMVLVVKLLLPGLWPAVLWLSLAAAPAAIAAWVISRRERFSRRESAAMLDRRLDAGGLLMTLSETSDAHWEARLAACEPRWRQTLPKVRPVHFARRLALPLVFAFGACFVPLRTAQTSTVLRSTAGRTAAESLEQTLELLEDADVLEEAEQEQLREEIEKLAEQAKETPLTSEDWETVDALREQLMTGLESSSLTLSKAENLVDRLLDAEAGVGQPLSSAEARELESALKQAMLEAPAGKSPGAQQALSPAMRQMLQSGQLRLSSDPQLRKQQLDQLRKMLKSESQRLSECRGQCQGCLGGLCEGKSGGLNDCPGKSNRPGRGGITRGRGDAELTWGDESDEQNTKFKETVLPPGYLDKPQEQIVSINPMAPEVYPSAEAPRARGRDSDPASGRETWNRNLRPKHRDVVRNYFDSK